MSIQLVESVKDAVDYIIDNENYKSPPEVDVVPGSEAGDGYGSKTYAISIKETKRNNINLFVKCLPKIDNELWKGAFTQAFTTEFKFYDEIYPAFNRFQTKRNIKNPFRNVPKHYKTNTKNSDVPPIVLENLRSLGYILRDRKKPVDDHHLTLPIQAFARYHAISYAMKDQEPEVFGMLTSDIGDFFKKYLEKLGFQDMLIKCVNQFMDSLDPVDDRNLLDHCSNLSEILIKHQSTNSIDEYGVMSQGDCWSNNMMFLYNEDTGLPIDVKLIDWQAQRISSPLLDFSYFFYTLATKEVLDNADHYLNLYYDTLSQNIIELGSDPEKMYPHKIFMEHWRKYALFGLSMAFLAVKAQLFEEGETPDLINSTDPMMDGFSVVLKNQDKYISRIKDIVSYFIDKGLL